MMNVLFDTNIVLDIALNRTHHYESSATLFELIDQKIICANITASSVTDIYYISKKEKGGDLAIQFISNLIDVVDVLCVDRNVIIKAIHHGMKDFEDSVQTCTAIINEVDILITRNKSDFLNSGLVVYTPSEFIASFK